MLSDGPINPNNGKERWVAYLDLMGIKNRIEKQSWFEVHDVYTEAIDSLKERIYCKNQVRHVFFSDSFILFTSGNDAKAYSALDSVVRQFILSLIRKEIPVRGAMSYGYLYADKKNSLYFGQALVESYQFGESQNWIGFVLCPTVVLRLETLGLPAHKRLNYAFGKIPWKPHCVCSKYPELPAFILGAGPSEEGQAVYRETLCRMKTEVGNGISMKYENTLAFLKKNVRESKG